jgi:hypothetical protein
MHLTADGKRFSYSDTTTSRSIRATSMSRVESLSIPNMWSRRVLCGDMGINYPISHEDLMQACDAVIGKPGYGNVAEFIADALLDHL